MPTKSNYGEILRGSDGLLAPACFWSATSDWISDHSNGCGPASAKIDLIPDKIMGIDFTPACIIHDICYSIGLDEEDKRLADRLFLFNLLTLVDAHSGALARFERIAQREAAFTYYKAVSDWGKKAFSGQKGPN